MLSHVKWSGLNNLFWMHAVNCWNVLQKENTHRNPRQGSEAIYTFPTYIVISYIIMLLQSYPEWGRLAQYSLNEFITEILM